MKYHTVTSLPTFSLLPKCKKLKAFKRKKNEASFLPKKLEVNVTNKHLNNAEVFFYVLEKTISREMFFYKGIPVISNRLDITLGIDEIINSNGFIGLSIRPLNRVAPFL